MDAVDAVIEGNTIKFAEPVPYKGKYEVKVYFVKPLEDEAFIKKQQAEKAERRKQLLELAGSWTDEEVKLMEEMVNERPNFFKGRDIDYIC